MIFKCDCSLCRKESPNKNYLNWKKINKAEYFNFFKKNIVWKKTSWYAWRGYNSNNDVIIMYYIWNMYYVTINYTNDAVELPLLFRIFTNFLNYFNIFLYKQLNI